MALAAFNKLPPKPIHLEKVKKALGPNECSEKELQDATGLTKTQLLCALEALIIEGVAVKNKATKKYAAVVSE